MAARVVELCKAIEAYIQQQVNSGGYSYTFNVLYANPSHYKLESTVTTWLYIYPGPEGPTTATRNKWRHEYSASLQLVNFVDSQQVPQPEIDDTFALMEEIIDSLKDARVAGMSLTEFSTEDNPEEPYVGEYLITHNLARSARRAIYQELR